MLEAVLPTIKRQAGAPPDQPAYTHLTMAPQKLSFAGQRWSCDHRHRSPSDKGMP